MPAKIINFQQAKKSLARCAENAAKGIAELAGITLENVQELDSAKADKPLRSAVTIPASGWADDGAADYPKHYDLAISGVTAADRADLTIAASSLSAALDCGFCPTTETRSGAVRVRAASVPDAVISAQLWIQKG